MKNRILTFTLTFSVLMILQNQAGATEIEPHLSHSHHDKSVMLGLNLGYASIESKDDHMQDDFCKYLGIHIMKHFESECWNNKLALAAGAHKIFTKDEHISAMIGLMYSPTKALNISVMPSVMWMKHENHSKIMGGMGGMGGNMTEEAKWKSERAIHFEISYNIQIQGIALTPSIGYMNSSSHNSLMFGFNFEL